MLTNWRSSACFATCVLRVAHPARSTFASDPLVVVMRWLNPRPHREEQQVHALRLLIVLNSGSPSSQDVRLSLRELGLRYGATTVLPTVPPAGVETMAASIRPSRLARGTANGALDRARQSASIVFARSLCHSPRPICHFTTKDVPVPARTARVLITEKEGLWRERASDGQCSLDAGAAQADLLSAPDRWR
jgi:hypothetical protein